MLKKFHGKGFEELQHISSIFSQSQITAEDVGKAGSRVFVNLYGGKNGQSLDNLRYYSLRVHLQIIVWKRLSNGHDDLNPSSGVGSLMEVC